MGLLSPKLKNISSKSQLSEVHHGGRNEECTSDETNPSTGEYNAMAREVEHGRTTVVMSMKNNTTIGPQLLYRPFQPASADGDLAGCSQEYQVSEDTSDDGSIKRPRIGEHSISTKTISVVTKNQKRKLKKKRHKERLKNKQDSNPTNSGFVYNESKSKLEGIT